MKSEKGRFSCFQRVEHGKKKEKNLMSEGEKKTFGKKTLSYFWEM